MPANWFEYQKPFFARNLPLTKLRVLQIGAYTGDATQWMLDNREVEFIHDVDIWADNGETQHFGLDFTEVERLWDSRFLRNSRVKKFKMSSNDYFRQTQETFNFIYVDGDHRAIQTALDGLNGWWLLEKGGVMAFDDYGWEVNPSEFLRPRRGIEALLAICQGEYVLIEMGYQVWIRKL